MDRLQAEGAALGAEVAELRELVAGQDATSAAEQELRARVRFCCWRQACMHAAIL